jgi:hypothetical protein
MSALPSLDAWRQKLPTKKAALRELLADGRFHSQQEMARVAGYRFGSALFDIHNELDVGAGVMPVHYEKKTGENDATRVRYRQVDKARCSQCNAEAREKPSDIIKRQAARIAELEAELAKVRR